MSKPTVTVIIPTYNRQALLREALDSVSRQSYSDYEVIVVDDGSSEPIARSIADHPTRPRVIEQQNSGPGAARNRGLEAAAGEIVSFLDSDDLWLPDKLARAINAIGANPDVRIWYGPMQPIDEGGRPVPGRTKPCHGGRITRELFWSSFVHVPTVVCRKDLLIRAGGFRTDLPVCEDYELWLRLSTTEPFGLIEDPLALRRLHPNRLSKSRMSRNLSVKARVLIEFYERESGFLDRSEAERRLAKVCLAASRASFRNGEYHRAREWNARSHQYGASMWQIAPRNLASLICGVFERQGAASPSARQGVIRTQPARRS